MTNPTNPRNARRVIINTREPHETDKRAPIPYTPEHYDEVITDSAYYPLPKTQPKKDV